MKEKKNTMNEENKKAQEKEEHKTKKEKKSTRSKKELEAIKKELDVVLEKVEELEKQNEELKDSLLRKIAEFENYKRRTEKDQLNLIEYAAESVLLKIIPVYDDLNRSLEHIAETDNVESIKEGLKMVAEKFRKTLEEIGVKKIETKDKQFDYNYHEALMQQNVEGVPPHTVISEIEPGYIYKDKVLKHAKVIVSEDNSETPGSEGNGEESN